MACKACAVRGKTWQGDNPRCAFKDETFGENWNCATVKVDHIEDLDGRPLALWVSWYKRRGATDAMWLLFEHSPPRRPTEQECLRIAQAYGSNDQGQRRP